MGTIPEGMTVNHKNGIKDDNRLSNLELCTPLENTQHAIAVLGTHKGDRNPAAKLREEDIPKIRELYASGVFSQQKIAGRFGVTQITISRAIRGTYWK